MKILVALPLKHPRFDSIDHILAGKTPVSGTYGSFIRLAGLLAEVGLSVVLSAASEIPSTQFACIKHENVVADEFDRLIVHESHWNGAAFTFGNHSLPKTFLWSQVRVLPAQVHTFFLEGGRRFICPSKYHTNYYRAIPQWRRRLVVIHNAYSPVFAPTELPEPVQPRLLFIGAIAPSKGFAELTRIWSYLASKQVALNLAIAGSRSLHFVSDQIKMSSSGLADVEMETNCIQPWLKALPPDYQPQFLGPLSPVQLRAEIERSWAVIVNPGWSDPETFCVAAVEAQACNKTVFSVKCGALKETVYQGRFKSLADDSATESVGNCILNGLSNVDAVAENGRLAGDFVRSTFKQEVIRERWLDLLFDQKLKPQLEHGWSNPRDLASDLLRLTGTGMSFLQNRHQANQDLMNAYQSSKLHEGEQA